MGSQTREIPPEIAEHFSEFFPDHEDFEDVLQDQEYVYQLIQSNSRNNKVSASTSDQISDSGILTENGGQISRSRSMDSELALALALSLQFVDDDFEIASTSESAGTAADSAGRRGSSSTVVGLRQDDVDPDNMTYEQLQTLTDAVGNESKGLAEEIISSLPSQKFKDKSGWFSSKKIKSPECVICLSEYKHGEWLTTLPCMHQYHKKCIKHWLRDHKTCPFCNNEISEGETSKY